MADYFGWADRFMRQRVWWRAWRGLPEPTSAEMALRMRACLEALEPRLSFGACEKVAMPVSEGKITIRKPLRYTASKG